MSNDKLDPIEELALLRMSVTAMREQINDSLDAMIDQINKIIPPENTSRVKKYKSFTRKDWANFLEF